MSYWNHLEKLVTSSKITIDRPKGSKHPRHPEIVYPLDYGYLEETASNDGDGIDIWIGSLPEPRVEGVITTIDLLKRDAEIKILYGCTESEITAALNTHNTSTQAAKLILRESR
jgi:inorganic pyrophosphatase